MPPAPDAGWVLRHSAVERWAVGLWVGSCVGVGLGWCAAQWGDRAGLVWPSALLEVICALIGLLAAHQASSRLDAAVWRAHRGPTTWTVRPDGAPADAGEEGRLMPMIDLGPWMLLRFDPTAGRGRSRWFGVGADRVDDWRGLRLALFGPGAITGAGPLHWRR